MSSLYNPTQTSSMARCLLPVYPRGGFVDVKEHDLISSSRWYVVTKGRQVGVYTHSQDATEQILHYTKGELQAFATYAEAKVHWASHCSANHLPWCPHWYEQNHEDNMQKWGVRGIPDLFTSHSRAFRQDEHDCRADKKYYCVTVGRVVGIYDNDVDSLAQLLPSGQLTVKQIIEPPVYMQLVNIILMESFNGLFAENEAIQAAASQGLPFADEYIRSSTNEIYLNNFARGV
ncbi:hypothetical protein C8J57DRAFT_1543615 [Mycena rebaudengoi]|nr:hypothetical protein C8J57DRAFT_1543615 [Mycena rebaudengoi]